MGFAVMKRILFLCSLFLFFWAAAQSPTPDVKDFDSAVKLLSTTKISRYAITEITINTRDDEKTKADMLKLFKSQLQAISLIHSSHKDIDLSILLPFLCATEDKNVGVWRTESKDINHLRSEWPVFSLIIDIPKASQLLETYMLDKKNPLEYRLDALQILAFVDQDKFKQLADQMKNEFAKIDLVNTRDFTVELISRWQRGGYEFDGGIQIPPRVLLERAAHSEK